MEGIGSLLEFIWWSLQKETLTLIANTEVIGVNKLNGCLFVGMKMHFLWKLICHFSSYCLLCEYKYQNLPFLAAVQGLSE